MPLWKGMAALELMSAAQQGLPPMGASDLMVIGDATTDTHDVLLVGSRTLDSIPKDLPKDPIQCFRTLALRYDAVVECVDSGFWRFSIADAVLAKAVRRSLMQQPDVHVMEMSL